jgi:serine/threonine-protein kinase ULK/ATG1
MSPIFSNHFQLRRQFITETESVIFLSQIVKAFVTLNQNNIIHRDLKPANILIHDNKIKIADFGFSRIMQNIEENTKIT